MSEYASLLAVILIGGLLASVISYYLELPRTFTFLSVGILLSVFELDPQTVTTVVKLSGIFVIFSTGTRLIGENLDAERLKLPITVSLLKTGIVWAVFTVIVYILGEPLSVALLTGLAACATSTAGAVGKIEKELERKLSHTRIAEVIGYADDIIAITFIGFLISGFSGAVGSFSLTLLASLMRPEIGRMLESIETSEHVYLFLAVTTALIGVSVSKFYELGLPSGALAAGLLISKYPDDVEVLESLKPLEAFFSSIFFISIGTYFVLTPSALGYGALVFLGATIITPVTTLGLIKLTGETLHTSLLSSILLSSVSEILLYIAVVSYQSFSAFVSGLILAALTTSVTAQWYRKNNDKIYKYMKEFDVDSDADQEQNFSNHTIIAGYGTSGKVLADRFENVLVIDNNVKKTESDTGSIDTVLGDARDHDTWKRCDFTHADTIISSLEDDEVAETIASLQTDANKYCMTRTVRDSRMLDLDFGVPRRNLVKRGTLKTLKQGLNNGFQDLREELNEKLDQGD